MNSEVVLERSFLVDKIQCEGCEANIEKHLLAQQGVLEAKVEPGTGKVCVRYNPLLIRFDVLPKIVDEAGFPRLFRFTEEHHQDYLWREKEEEVVSQALGRAPGKGD